MTAIQTPVLPVRDPGRALKIAALHALAEWFAEHPDVAMPTQIQLNHHIGFDDEPDAGLRGAAVRQFAARHDVHYQQEGTMFWADLPLHVPGFDACYAMLTSLRNTEAF